MSAPARVRSQYSMRAGLAMLALVAGCDSKPPAPPTAPPAEPPPLRIEAITPPPRSTLVSTETPIWVQFGGPLDTTTANDRTVFFKLDTRRISIGLRWEAATRRLFIVPHEVLSLRRTYTVELASSIAFTDGGNLGRDYSWQFSTISLRRPDSPLPMDRRLDESPFVTLRWSGLTEPGVGAVVYEIHVSADSATAADPAQPALATLAGPPFLPRARWRQDGPIFWAIHARNTETGERLASPVWRFDTFAADAPYDSVEVPAFDWNWVDVNAQARQHCTEDSIAMRTGSITSTIRWDLGAPDSTAKLADVGIELSPRYAAHVAVTGPSVWYATAAWNRCVSGWNGPPFTDEANGQLALAEVISPTRIRFSSDALAAHVEATRRLGGYYGYMFRCPFRRTYFGPGAGNPAVRATLWLHVHRATP